MKNLEVINKRTKFNGVLKIYFRGRKDNSTKLHAKSVIFFYKNPQVFPPRIVPIESYDLINANQNLEDCEDQANQNNQNNSGKFLRKEDHL